MKLGEWLTPQQMAELKATTVPSPGGFDTQIRNERTGQTIGANAFTTNKATSEKVTTFVNDFYKKTNSQIAAPRSARRHEKAKMSKSARHDLIAAALALDEVRAVKFIEDFHTLNILVRMLAQVYDDMCFFFDDLTPQAVKQTMSNAERDIFKLLNSVYYLLPEKDDKVLTAKGETANEIFNDKMWRVANLLRERLSIVVNHAFEADTIWRVDELDKKLESLFTEEYMAKRRHECYLGVQERLKLMPDNG